MKVFLKFFFITLFGFASLYSDEFRDVKIVKLKKDEVKTILVKYHNKTRLFKFRWTLYKNNGLVIHHSYDKIVAQNILYMRNKNKSFRVKLKPRNYIHYNKSYLLVKFKEFDYKTEKAIFEIFLADKTMDIKLKYLKDGV